MSGHQGTNTISVLGTVTDTGGAYQGTQTFTIPAGNPPNAMTPGFFFAPWNATTAGQNLTIDVVLDTTLTGTYNFSTGALTTNPANFRAVITTQDADVDNDPMTMDPGPVYECEVGKDNDPDPDGAGPEQFVAGSGLFPLTFSTENTPTPPAGSFLGERFSPAFPPGVGAITALWSDTPQAVPTDLTPEAGENCSLVQGIQHGQGGLWLAKGKGVGGFARQPTPTNPAPPANPGDNRNEAAYKVCLKKAKKLKGKKKKNAIKKCKKKFGF
jgi:hypothetical protein